MENNSSLPIKKIMLGFILVVIAFAVVAAIVAIVFLNGQNNSDQPSASGDRVTGNTQSIDGEIDAEVHEDTRVGRVLGADGGVLSISMKKGGTAYLIVPQNVLSGNNVVLSEFSEMPTASTHVPLYTDLGFGLNIGISDISWELETPAYLVFDYSDGSSLSKWTGENRLSNYCNYTSVTFEPKVCATILEIDYSSTQNSEMIAVGPMYADDGRTPTFPVYSYYLGDKDILVVEVDNTEVVIPQKLTTELAIDLVKSTFGNFTEEKGEIEAYDLMRSLELDLVNSLEKEALTEVLLGYSMNDHKTMLARDYMQKLYSDAQNSGKYQEFELSLPELEVNKSADEASRFTKLFSNFRVGSDARAETVRDVADIRRAYDSSEPGAEEIALQALDGFVEAFKDEVYSDHEVPYALIAEGILIGKGKFKNSVEGETSGGFGGAAADAGSGWAGDVADAFDNAASRIANYLEWLELAQMLDQDNSDLADRLRDELKKAVEDAMESAESDEDIIRAAELCQLIIGGSSCDDIVEKAKKAFLRLCAAEVEAKNLSNFAVQTELMKCKQIVGE